MNNSPTLPKVLRSPANDNSKPTVPEMFLLGDLIGRAASNLGALRAQLDTCTPEERAFLHRFFAQAAR